MQIYSGSAGHEVKGVNQRSEGGAVVGEQVSDVQVHCFCAEQSKQVLCGWHSLL